MNVLFMIGNGFDINLGLYTKYTDFIEVYRKIQPTDNDIIKRFKNDIIGENLSLWSDAELAFGKQTLLIAKTFTVEDYCKCHSHFCTELANYLRGEQKRFELCKANWPVVYRNFSKAVNNLMVGFRDVPREQMQKTISFYNRGGMTFNFIDFNYTYSLDVLCGNTNESVGWGVHNNEKNTMGKLIHVHGTIDKDMILGVHDESQVANAENFKPYDEYYIAQLIKSQTDSINEENIYKKAIQLLNTSHFIYIYGMSLGDTDKFWWENICRLLKQNAQLQVIIHCYDAPENNLLRADIKRFEDKQRAKLFDLGNIDKEQQNSLKNRVHVTGANIFKDLADITSCSSGNQIKAV